MSTSATAPIVGHFEVMLCITSRAEVGLNISRRWMLVWNETPDVRTQDPSVRLRPCQSRSRCLGVWVPGIIQKLNKINVNIKGRKIYLHSKLFSLLIYCIIVMQYHRKPCHRYIWWLQYLHNRSVLTLDVGYMNKSTRNDTGLGDCLENFLCFLNTLHALY